MSKTILYILGALALVSVLVSAPLYPFVFAPSETRRVLDAISAIARSLAAAGAPELLKWILVLSLSTIAIYFIGQKVHDRWHWQQRVASLLGALCALIPIVFLFDQPHIARALSSISDSGLLVSSIAVASLVGGWYVWALPIGRRRGEIFLVATTTMLVGAGWFALLAGSGAIQVLVGAFLFGSLSRLSIILEDTIPNPFGGPRNSDGISSDDDFDVL